MDFGRISRRRLLQGSAALTLGTALGARHAAAAAALKKMPDIKVVEEEKVAETDACEKTMESMINLDGATLLFPTSFGYYSPHMIKMASKYPKLRFEHCGGLWKDPKNAGSYFGYIDEAQYISGIVAGYSTKSGNRGQADPAGAAQYQRLA
jgi:basic membrane protein A and related proteins